MKKQNYMSLLLDGWQFLIKKKKKRVIYISIYPDRLILDSMKSQYIILKIQRAGSALFSLCVLIAMVYNKLDILEFIWY